MPRTLAVLVALVTGLLLASCGSAPAPPSASPTSAEASSTPIVSESVPSATPEPSEADTPQPTPVAGQLPVPGFVTVSADALTVRQEPGVDAEPVIDRSTCIDNPNPCERPFTLGRDRGYLWGYVFDGPVNADGYAWYLLATEMNTEHQASMWPEAVGWVASGDSEDAWLVADERSCPDEPIELAEVTNLALTKLEMLHCLGDRQVTLHGWLPALGSSEDDSALIAECRNHRPWLTCGSLFDVVRPANTELGDANYLEFVIDPEAGIVVPARGQWVMVTGAFDHPDAASCGDTAAILICRFSFVLTSIDPE